MTGFAAVYNQLSVDLGGFRERIAPGAFAAAFEPGADVRSFFAHNDAYVLGRTVAGTLRLIDDAFGLRVEIDLPDTSFAADLQKMISRGDVNQMSFGFRTISDLWAEESNVDGTKSLIRTLTSVNLLEVSPVSIPAYPQTSVALALRSAKIHASRGTLAADMLRILQAMQVRH